MWTLIILWAMIGLNLSIAAANFWSLRSNLRERKRLRAMAWGTTPWGTAPYPSYPFSLGPPPPASYDPSLHSLKDE